MATDITAKVKMVGMMEKTPQMMEVARMAATGCMAESVPMKRASPVCL